MRSHVRESPSMRSGRPEDDVIAGVITYKPAAHFFSMKITEDVRMDASEQVISDEEALQKGMDVKSNEFVEGGAEVYKTASPR